MTTDPSTFNWRDAAQTIDLETLGKHDPFESLERSSKLEACGLLVERARGLPQPKLVQGYLDGRFGQFGYHFANLIDSPGRWGYRDNDADAKELTRALKRKGQTATSVAGPAVEAARTRFDSPREDAIGWHPLHRTDKVRVKLLSLAVAGELEVSPEDRRIFSPLPKDLTRELGAAGPLPLVPLDAPEPVEYVDLSGAPSKSLKPKYPERWLIAWCASASASYVDVAGSEPIAPVEGHILVGRKPHTVWGYLPRRHTYLITDPGGWISTFAPHASSPESRAAMTIKPRKPTETHGPCEGITAWAGKSAEEVRAILLADVPDPVRTACRLDAAVLAKLYAIGGRIDDDGHLVLPHAAFVAPAGTFDLQFADRMYTDVEDAPAGAYHQLAYSETLQTSLCIRAEDESADPRVYHIDHENWFRGNFGSLGSFLSWDLKPRA